MKKLRMLLNRISSMSFKKMFMMIKQIHKEYNKNSLIILIDMIFCALKNNIGYQDYRVFGFAKLNRKERKTFLTMNHNLALVRKMNNKEFYETYNNKTLFLKKYTEYIKRDWIDLNKKTAHEFQNFCKNKESVFAKTPSSFGGQGIVEIKITPYINFEALYKELIKSGQTLVEEKIIQHEKMSSLHTSSLNTVRVVTLKKDGKIIVISRILRMGQEGNVIDNITSGGIYAPVDALGVVSHPAFCDKTGETFKVHPTSKTFLIGFEVPYFKEAIDMVTKIATEETEMNYIGWDVAITPDGPLIVEGNNLPSYEIMQNYLHRNNNEGLLPRIEKIIGEKL